MFAFASRLVCRLPQPSPGDLFLDLEGDPFAGKNGREYLFGLVSLSDAGQPVYQARWALTSTDEARGRRMDNGCLGLSSRHARVPLCAI
jgi:hypothetical protein